MTNKETFTKAMGITEVLEKELAKKRLEVARIDLEVNEKALNISPEAYDKTLSIAFNHRMDFDTLAEAIKRISKILTNLAENSRGAYPIYF
jgi:hypothetical protein